MENKSILGFNAKPIEETDGYIGEFVYATGNGNGVYGILEKVEKDYAYFRPSMVGYADNTVYIEKEIPTRLVLPLIKITPIKGTLEEYVEVYNKHLKQDKPE